MNVRAFPCPCGSGRLIGPADLVYGDPCYAYEAEARAGRVTAWRAARAAARHASTRVYDKRWGLDLTPTDVCPDHPDPARRMTFYTGVGHPYHLGESPVPLFVAATTLSRYQRRGDAFPARWNYRAPWAGDSGAYAALMLRADPSGHPWFAHPDEYGAMWVRLVDDVGATSPYGSGPDFVGIQDWPCEAQCLARTGGTVREHQRATLDNYLYLSREFPMVPWLRTLQGWAPHEYVTHAGMYADAGVDLAGHPVGVGSVCRRGSQHGVAAVIRALAPLGARLHGFGVSMNALRLVGDLLASADSQAWSSTARAERILLPGCEHLSRPDAVTGVRVATDCRNCFRYALVYREEVLQALRDGAVAREATPTLF